MAKRKSKKGGAGLGLLLLAIIFITLILIITPFVLFFGWIITVFQYKKAKSKLANQPVSSSADFWLASDEKKQFNQLAELLSKAFSNIDKINEMGDSEGIDRNKDGQFSVRGRRGKELNAILAKNQQVVSDYSYKFSRLETLPQARWNSYNHLVTETAKKFTKTYAFGIGFVSWGISLLYFVKQYFGNIKEGLEAVMYYPVDVATMVGVMFLGGKPPDNPDRLSDWKIMLIITGISVLTYFIARFILPMIAKKTVKNPYPFPPRVRVDNYDEY